MKPLAVEKRFSIILDIKQSISNQEFEVVDDDNGNIIEITVVDDGQPINLTGSKVCAIFSTGPNIVQQDTDGHGVTISGENGNIVTIDLYTTSFSPGMVECELQIFSGADLKTLITSSVFNFECRRGIANSDTVQSTDEWPLLVGLLERVENTEEELVTLNTQTTTAAAAANTAASAANTAAEEAEAINTTVTAAEALRVAAEQGRASAEQSRVTAEQGRVSAEQGRETGTASAVAAAQAATDRANAAAAAAEEVVAGAIAPHASTHASGGSDPITPESIGAAVTGHTHTPASIGAASATKEITGTLLATAWADGANTVSGLTGVTAQSKGCIGLPETATAQQRAAAKEAQLALTGKAAGSVTITADGTIPTIDIPFIILIMG